MSIWCQKTSQDWKQNFKVQANQLPFSPQPNWSSYSALSLLFRTFFITLTAVVVNSVQTDALFFVRLLKMLKTEIQNVQQRPGKKRKIKQSDVFQTSMSSHLTYKLALQLSEIGTSISPVFTHHHISLDFSHVPAFLCKELNSLTRTQSLNILFLFFKSEHLYIVLFCSLFKGLSAFSETWVEF